MQKKTFIGFVLILSLSSIHASLPAVRAASPSPTPTASPSPASDQTATDNLKMRLKEALSTSGEPGNPLRAYIGIVRDVIKDTIVIDNKDGKKDLKLTDETVILRSPGNSPIKVENIRIDDAIIAIGLPGDGGVLTAKRLIVSTTPFATPAKSSGMGTISKIDKTSLTLALADKEQKLTLSDKTIIKSPVGVIKLVDLAVGDTVIYTAHDDEDGSENATIIMRVKTASL